MTKAGDSLKPSCHDCVSWVKLSDQDGGIGICDSIVSDHNQHLIGYMHPACDVLLIVEQARKESDATLV